MSYISALYKKNQNEILVWEKVDGIRKVVSYPASDYLYFYTENQNGEYTSIYGKKLKRHDFLDWDEFCEAKNKLNKVQLYESDVPPEIKVLSQHYYGSEPPKLNVTLLDIEVDYNPVIGFASPLNPYAPINAIALHHIFDDGKEKSIVIAVPPKDWKISNFDKSLEQLSEIVLVSNEKQLLTLMLEQFEKSDVLSGWNSNFFDIPYICKRIERVLGKTQLKKMSFEFADPPRFREVEIFGNIQITCDLSGRVHLDYLDLFKKYEVVERPSYKLESIAEEVLPDLPKLKYEGSLADLYKRDFNYFLRYNIRDTEILKGFEHKLGYIALANTMCHTSTAQFRDVFGTLKLTDYAIINYCHYELNVKVPDWKEKNDESAQGAYVLYPQKGLHEWIGLIDVNSLYPNSIISINISPEKLIGQFEEKENATLKIFEQTDDMLTLVLERQQEVLSKTAKQWRQWLIEHKYSISGYGTVFDQSNGMGILPAILTDWYAKRKFFQKKKAEARQKREELLAKYKN